MPRGRRSRPFGIVVLCVLVAACSANGPRTSSPASRASLPTVPPSGEAQRSDRGNPPFYDVLGKRYHVLPSSAGYRQRGVASWYGADFHGLVTSSGETYDMNAMTAAHTTLPIPTWVEVTNLGNGKQVVVKVNDRGPFVDNRLIDLSYAAAMALDMVRNGTARVEVRALPALNETARAAAGPPRVEPVAIAAAPPRLEPVAVAAASTPRPPAPVAPGPRMFVQVGAFSERDNAVRLVERLRSNGFGNPMVVSDASGRRALHRVRLGPIADASEFDRLRGQLRTLGIDAQLVVDR
jgi:peptidoglycan lytic transglycosylase